jgi:outer membrane receptor protein involved in Fe transport
MKRAKLLAVCLFWISFNFLEAQNSGKIVGMVSDVRTGDALAGCNIMIQNTTTGAAADVDGYFMILNVPPGEYSISAVMVGYRTQIQQNVKIISNLTTTVNFSLGQETLQGEEITIVGFKTPPVQKDLTYKIQSVTADEISRIPIRTINDLITQQAGVVRQVLTRPVSSLPVFGQFATVPSDGLHFRGGRENETLYLLDGVNVVDGLWGGYSLDQMGELAISSLETYSGAFDPKYGEAMSGVVNISSHDHISIKPRFSVKGITDRHGIDAASQNTSSGEIFFAGALPYYNKLGVVLAHRSYSTDGYIFGYIYPEYVNSEGQDKSGTPQKAPMQFLDTRFTLGKLLWQPVNALRVTLGGYKANTRRGVYHHYFKYNPYGTPNPRLSDDLVYGKVNYLINPKSFLTVFASYYNRGFVSRVYDDPAFYNILPQTGTAEFSTTGEDWVYFDTNFRRREIGADYSLQVNKIHNVTLGLTYEKLLTELSRKNPDGGEALEAYRYKPLQIGGFIHEKMEFDEMGMVVNLGARFDYIDSKRKVLEDMRDLTDLSAPLKNAKAQFYVTPRLGISFPVAEKAAVRFGYGHYYQFPNYYKVFQGTYLLAATGEYRPNPQLEQSPIAANNIKAERTINYEVGIQNKFTETVSADITGFYRKTSNLIGVILAETYEGKRFQTLGNMDYATVKGIEISLKRQFSDHFSAFLNYTFSKTLVSTSVLFEMPTDEARTFPADWDQPHSVRGHVYFEADNGMGFSIYGSASSGYPYTRSSFNPNGERAPWIHELDMNIFKNFSYFGFKQQVFLQINNLPNRKNIWWVYSDSGIAGDDANAATSHDYTNNPAMYGPGRTIQLGIKIWN